jgi:hypothetical protein
LTSAEVPDIHPIDSSDVDGAELGRLQSRLDALTARIHDAIPEGYDLDALIKASDEGHETEDVYDITSEKEALTGLTGPLNVPGKTPPPAFELDEEEALAMARAEAAHESVRRNGIVLFAIVMVVIIAAMIGLFVVIPAL